jgi:hypothetical protein
MGMDPAARRPPHKTVLIVTTVKTRANPRRWPFTIKTQGQWSASRAIRCSTCQSISENP